MTKEKIIKELDRMSKEGMEKTDLYMFDFVDFINNTIAPHITHKGLDLLKREYQTWIDNNDNY